MPQKSFAMRGVNKILRMAEQKMKEVDEHLKEYSKPHGLLLYSPILGTSNLKNSYL
jgi:hypothetical protein